MKKNIYQLIIFILVIILLIYIFYKSNKESFYNEELNPSASPNYTHSSNYSPAPNESSYLNSSSLLNEGNLTYNQDNMNNKINEILKDLDNSKFIIDPKLSEELDKVLKNTDTELDLSYKMYRGSIIIKDNGDKLNKMNKIKLDEILRKLKTTHYLHNQNKFSETSNLDYNIDMSRFNVILADANKYIISYISPNLINQETIFSY